VFSGIFQKLNDLVFGTQTACVQFSPWVKRGRQNFSSL